MIMWNIPGLQNTGIVPRLQIHCFDYVVEFVGTVHLGNLGGDNFLQRRKKGKLSFFYHICKGSTLDDYNSLASC